ncbi:MAG: hypothetical protein HY423_11790 [Candidatus Lambdaproteobacteria bacterium]|nr:hypothetical protein [Candidatus Lambdaproteobacteria bacterium]
MVVPVCCVLSLVLSLAALGGLASRAQGQAPEPGRAGSDLLAGALFGGQPELFAGDGRIKMLVLGLQPFGLTESAAEQIGLILEKNLVNTGQFSVVGARQLNKRFEKERPELVDCRAIACGVESGKLLGADKVLVGTIRMDQQVFSLQVRLINTANNLTDYEERIRFTDETLEEDMFKLVNHIGRNSLQIGRVLSTSIRGPVISLGRKHGLKIGDHLVLYKQEQPITSPEGQQVDIQRKNIGIVKVLNVNENTSEALVVHSNEEPQVSHFVKTYLDPARQIELVDATRREIDTGIRLANRIQALELTPIQLADTEKRAWLRRINETQAQQAQWLTWGALGAAGTLAFMYTYDDTDLGRGRLLAAAVFTGYAAMEYLSLRNKVNDLRVEGRTKGYLGWQLRMAPLPGGLEFRLAYNF